MLFLANHTCDDSDEVKILFMLSKMSGEGFTTEWGNVKGDEIAETGVFGTWDMFLKDMKWVFNDPRDWATALNELERLKQGTLEAPEFFAKFKMLM